MKKNVRELEGVELDYWFAKANNLECISIMDGICFAEDESRYIVEHNFSKNWKFVGPIIERKKIALIYDDEIGCWYSEITKIGPEFVYGPTPLIAAMRCFVLSKFGDYVDMDDQIWS